MGGVMQLLKCPFCLSKNVSFKIDHAFALVSCDGCGFVGPRIPVVNYEIKATKAWNEYNGTRECKQAIINRRMNESKAANGGCAECD